MEQVSHVSTEVISHMYGWGVQNFTDIQKVLPEIQYLIPMVPTEQSPTCVSSFFGVCWCVSSSFDSITDTNFISSNSFRCMVKFLFLNILLFSFVSYGISIIKLLTTDLFSLENRIYTSVIIITLQVLELIHYNKANKLIVHLIVRR
jgi:hypothetical protein